VSLQAKIVLKRPITRNKKENKEKKKGSECVQGMMEPESVVDIEQQHILSIIETLGFCK
jgi:hypothetical protein